MAGLQRFITYIYKYENDEKMENAGFAKIEIRGNICRIEVHIRNISTEQPESTVYLFARNEKIMHGIPVGSISVSRGSGDVRYAFETKELSNFNRTIEEMEGIFIPLDDNNYLASQWKEGVIEKNLFHVLEQQEADPNAQKENVQEEEIQAVKEQEEKMQEVNLQEEDVQEEKIREEPVQLNSEDTTIRSKDQNVRNPHSQKTDHTPDEKEEQHPIQATELPEEEFFEEYKWERIFRKLRLKQDIFFPFEGQEIECVRMQLNDLQEFPKKYWYIGNNSFLLHGFFNYKHIIFGEMTEGGKAQYFIGVPGVFQNQERIMATMFGFPEFRTAKTTEYKTGNFGYWYRFI